MIPMDTNINYEYILQRTRDMLRTMNETSDSRDQKCINFAKIGFQLYGGDSIWGAYEDLVLNARLQGDLSIEVMDWHEESSDLVSFFFATCVGASLGLYAQKQIDNVGFLKGDFAMTNFIMEKIDLF